MTCLTPEEFRRLIQDHQGQFKVIIEEFQTPPAAVAVPVPQAVANAPEVSSLAIKLPIFWTSEPELWFLQVEASFENRHPKITRDESKFSHVLQHLPQEVLVECQHAVTNQNSYTVLKAALISEYGRSEAKKNAELLELNARKGGALGDKKPSSFLRKIRTLSNSSYEAMERAMFLHHMPTTVRTALASSKATSNDALAAEADAVMEQFQLAREANSIPHAIAAVDVPENTASFRPRPQNQQPTQRPSSSRGASGDSLCYLHRKFGVYAFSCKSSSCPMKHQVMAPPAQGNARAGR